MRLIAGTARAGRYPAAAEIKLEGNAITYWRAPGDAGVPPSFSFEGSTNVAAAEVAYPAPTRINEQGLEAFGYRHDVIFPIAVHALDAAKPVHLKLTMNYAVCDNICLPVRAVAELELPQTAPSSENATIADANARVPIAIGKEEAAKRFEIASDPGATPPTWIFTWKGETPTDLFAEGGQGWDIEVHRLDQKRFSLVVAQRPPSDQKSQASIQLTLTTPQRSYAFSVTLALPNQVTLPGTK